MNLFTKIIKAEEEEEPIKIKQEPIELKTLTTAAPPEEEWIWVEGYKGTTSDMRGYGDFQFTLKDKYEISDEEKISCCSNGFHFCLNLIDVFNHYPLKDNNRFFKVQALVQKKDYKRGYSISTSSYSISTSSYGSYSYGWPLPYNSNGNKLVAKSIILVEEIETEEILRTIKKLEDFPDVEEWPSIRALGVQEVIDMKKIDTLIELGFSEPFALMIKEKRKIDKAITIASQPNLSMDMKAYLIFKD